MDTQQKNRLGEKGNGSGEKAQTVSLDAARIALQDEARGRSRGCYDEIQAVLKKHNCTLNPVIQLTNGNVSADYSISPLAAQ